jgi:hypothetical protein
MDVSIKVNRDHADLGLDMCISTAYRVQKLSSRLWIFSKMP